MTAEEYIIKECSKLPMSVLLDIKAAFEAGYNERKKRELEKLYSSDWLAPYAHKRIVRDCELLP